eukprot:TRINITY_DN10866_c1_g1_i3.p4 TRINITY_DN10866_c1_g1~~TRINITY_DN10866_c1_g1_i3.p4  ORF type:complete len:179 (+),score=21.03 TRINITY_DN10866_c1_g1_i3:2-538(+)
MVERETDFMDFSIYRMRVFDGASGKEVAQSLGTSEPTVSRRLAKVRDQLRVRIGEVISTYSFTEEEQEEAERNGLALNPKTSGDRADDALFDECLAEIYARQTELRDRDQLLTDQQCGRDAETEWRMERHDGTGRNPWNRGRRPAGDPGRGVSRGRRCGAAGEGHWLDPPPDLAVRDW